MVRSIAASLLGFTTLGLLSIWQDPAFAGPVARELAARGDNVGIPKARPQDSGTLGGGANSDSSQLDFTPTDQPANTASKPQNTTSETASVGNKEVIVRETIASSCFSELSAIAEAERTSTPEADDPACQIPEPIVLKRTRSRFPIQFTKGLTLDCPFALSLARFANDTTQALARHHLGITIDTVVSGEGFVCRRRNNVLTGKLSEHAFGNATDWVGFKFTDGTKLAIVDTNKLDADEATFLNSVRKAACGTFTTILGPGSNAAHATHFHFDLGRSKEKKSPYRICE